MASEMKPAYLIHGTDDAKIDLSRHRLRTRAEAEGGTAGLEVFDLLENRGSPDADALVASISSMSLMPGRRYLLADHVEKWGKNQAERVSEAVVGAPPEVTVVLIARGKVPAGIAEAVAKVGGETLSFAAPEGRDLPVYLVHGARERGFELSPEAAAMLISHLGDGQSRLANELDRLALWAEPGGTVEPEDLEEMVSDSSEVKAFALGDAVVAGDRRASLMIAERLMDQGSSAAGAVYSVAMAVRRVHKAIALLDSGAPPNRIGSELKLPPFIVRQVMEAARSSSQDAVRDAAVALADLELWTRGGAEYPEELALDMALVAATDDVV
ncbi:MAG: DNA polymerase III subunit delta [Solirubrobacterales bacterium]